MPESAGPVVQLRDVTKDYRALRPLRVRSLEIRRGQSLALLGFDAPMAEVLVNLITGGSLPDTGEVLVFGEPTNGITDRGTWLQMLDHFGLISDRAVLLEQLSAEQNLAIPLSLAVESMSDELRLAVRKLATEVGLRRIAALAFRGAATGASQVAHPSRPRSCAQSPRASRRASNGDIVRSRGGDVCDGSLPHSQGARPGVNRLDCRSPVRPGRCR